MLNRKVEVFKTLCDFLGALFQIYLLENGNFFFNIIQAENFTQNLTITVIRPPNDKD